MINPTLERAAMAVAEEAAKHDLTYSYGYDNGSYEAIARAVLMAVLPTLERRNIQDEERSMLGWCQYPAPDGEFVSFADLQAILNDGEGE